MKFRTEIIDSNVAVIHGDGRLNMVSAPTLREVVGDVIAAGQNRVVVNLSGVEFMDSSGLGSLVGCLKRARQAGGDLRISAPTAQVAMVLQLSNLDRVLITVESAHTAYTD